MSPDSDSLAGQSAGISRVHYRGDHPRLRAELRGELRLSPEGVELYARNQDEPALSLPTDEISEINVTGAGWFPRLSVKTSGEEATFTIRFRATRQVWAAVGSIDALDAKVVSAGSETVDGREVDGEDTGDDEASTQEAISDDADAPSEEPLADLADDGDGGAEVDKPRPALEPGRKVKFTTFRRNARGLRSEPDELAAVTSWPIFVTSTVERVEGDWAYLHTSIGHDGWVKTECLRAMPQALPDAESRDHAQQQTESAEDEELPADGQPSLSGKSAGLAHVDEPLNSMDDEAQPATVADESATPEVKGVQLGWLSTAEVPVATGAPAGYRTCATCGGDWPIDSIFCGDCGSRFDAPDTETLDNWSDIEQGLTTRPDIPGVRVRHLTPDAGLQAMVAPDPNAPLAPFLSGRIAVLVTDTRGSWAQVELDSDSATAGWVDGRKLIPPAQDATPATTTDGSVPAMPGLSGRTSTELARNWIAGLASAGILLGVLLDWFSFPGTNAFHVPFALLFDYKSPSADPKLAYFLLACGLVGLILSFVEGTRAGRFVCGGGALLFSILFVVWLGHDLPSSVSVTDLMGPGPWVAGISGLILMISPAITWNSPSVPVGPK